MLKLSVINKVYYTTEIETAALNNINLEIKKGEFVSVMGPSGSGKSTFLNIVGLLDKPQSGKLEIDGIDVSTLSERKKAALRNRKIGFIFQNYHLINDLSVLDNVELPLLYRKLSGKEMKKLSTEALENVMLGHRMRHFPHQLSGGQSQRVAIARAIVGKPEIILADEPTGNLDSAMGGEIMDILLKLNKESGTTIVMVTHDEHLAKQADRIIRFFDGCQVF